MTNKKKNIEKSLISLNRLTTNVEQVTTTAYNTHPLCNILVNMLSGYKRGGGGGGGHILN